MQIYTNFESNSQLSDVVKIHIGIVSDANLHKFWKQFTTYFLCVWKFLVLFPMQIYTNFESNSQPYDGSTPQGNIVSDANLHKFWKQFTTWGFSILYWTQLFPMQIYTNFESNSQHEDFPSYIEHNCFRCKFTQILKAIHNECACRNDEATNTPRLPGISSTFSMMRIATSQDFPLLRLHILTESRALHSL